MQSAGKSANSKVDWIVELFPFNVADPLDTNLVSRNPLSDLASIQIFSTKSNTSDNIASGLRSLSLSRSKSSPDGACNMSYVGSLPTGAVIGTWVIVSTSSGPQGEPIPRFFGQIYDVASAYMTQSNGLVSLQHDIKVREWSSCLRMEVRFNPVSILAALASQNNASSVAGIAAGLVAAAGPTPTFTPEMLGKIFEASVNPYEMAQVILTLIGAINSLDTADNVKDLQISQYSQVATGMPAIPQALLTRMGVDSSVTSANAFAPTNGKQGFVNVISGIQTGPIKNDGTWTGILKDSEFQDLKDAYNPSPGDKPASVSVAALSQMSFSAWEILTNFCEPTVNEVFTDMLYVIDDNNNIIPRPTIFFRDKPFLMDDAIGKIKDLGLKVKTSWSSYENLPRVKIDDVFIIGLKLSESFLNSPNYIQADLASSLVSKDLASSAALATGLVKLQQLQDRWGGDPAYPSVSYTFINAAKGKTTGGSSLAIAPDSSLSLPDYFVEIKSLIVAWHSFNYLMGSGILMIKDPGVPMTIGTNVQFSFGDRTLIGHIESIEMQMSVSSSGNIETNVQLHLQRIVVREDSVSFPTNGVLRMFKIGECSRLHLPKLAGDSSSSAASGAAANVANLLDTIIGFGP